MEVIQGCHIPFFALASKYMRSISYLPLLALVTMVLTGCTHTEFVPPSSSVTSNSSSTTSADILKNTEPSVIVKNLEIPWDIAFLPEGEILITERPGRLLLRKTDGAIKQIQGLPKVRASGESGLLGIALHPNFNDNHWVYLYFTDGSLGSTKCHVERFRLDGETLTDRKTIIEGIPGAIYHDGGRIAFGPDGMLYITTGDAGNASAAQDLVSLSGKILRVKDDGSIPTDNPFQTAVWSYGHRNPQGLAWDDKGRLWSTEHGRSGIQTGYDELNLIERGANYGWPTIQGDAKREGMKSPMAHSGPSTTWAPASAVYKDGKILFGGLKDERLYEADIQTNPPTIKEYFVNAFGRIRTVTIGPDSSLYLTTSNRDGRGTPTSEDDRIIRVEPK